MVGSYAISIQRAGERISSEDHMMIFHTPKYLDLEQAGRANASQLRFAGKACVRPTNFEPTPPPQPQKPTQYTVVREAKLRFPFVRT